MRIRALDCLRDPLPPMSLAGLHPGPSLAPTRVVLEQHCLFVEVAMHARNSCKHYHGMPLGQTTYVIDLGHRTLIHRVEEIMIREALCSSTFLH